MKELTRGIKINFIGNLFRISRAAFFFCAVALYGTEQFGVYTLVWTTVEMVILFGTLGIDQGLLFELAHLNRIQDDKKLYQRIATTLKTMFALTFVEVTLLALYVHLYVDGAPIRQGFYLLLPCVPLYNSGLVLLKATMGLKEMKYNAIIRSSLEPAFMLIFLLLFWKSPLRFQGILLAQALALVATALLCIHSFGKFFSWKKVFAELRVQGSFIDLFRYSIPIYLADGFDNLLYRVDIFLISALLGTGTAEQRSLIGVYGLAKQIARAVTQTKKAFTPIFISMTSESFLGKDIKTLESQVRYSMEKLLLLNIVLSLFLSLFGKELINLFGKNSSLITEGTFLWLLMGQVIFSTVSLLVYFLVATKSSGRILTLMVLVLGAAAITGVKVIRTNGVFGAAVIVGASYILLSLGTVLETIRLFGSAFITRRSWKIIASGFLAGLICLGVKLTVPVDWNPWLKMITAFLPALIIYFGLTIPRQSWKGIFKF